MDSSKSARVLCVGSPRGRRCVPLARSCYSPLTSLAGCKDANPGLASQLDTLFRTATFEHEGKVFKCHPSYK